MSYSGGKIQFKSVTIFTNPIFERLFPRKQSTIDSIAEDMGKRGFSKAHPLILADWPDASEPFLLDGHTRARAALKAGVEPEIAPILDFESEAAALDHAIYLQKVRRNLTDAELASCLEVLDSREKPTFHGNQYKSGGASDEARPKTGKSADITAKKLGVSRAKVERTRAALKDSTQREAVLSGEKTINKAYEEMREAKQAEVSNAKFNLTNDNIEWAKWSWNPVTGCQHGCKYCYARDIAARFGDQSLPKEKRFDYTVHKNRFSAPMNTKIPTDKASVPGMKNVFVCSMADLFGKWVDPEVIQEILDVCENSPQWTYLFLTKNPKKLLDFKFPKNSWVGTTVDVKSRVSTALEVMPQVDAPVKFISCEPLLEDLEIDDLTGIDWVIIGGCSKSSGGPAIQPAWEWVEKIYIAAYNSGCQIYFKPNLETRPKQYPQQIPGETTKPMRTATRPTNSTSILIDSPYELTEIIREHYRPDQIKLIINFLQSKMAA